MLFDDAVRQIKSAAVLRIALWREGRTGLVAFGSSDYDGFSADMGAELVAFVAPRRRARRRTLAGAGVTDHGQAK